jgi:N-carbamoylputrescine amidase
MSQQEVARRPLVIGLVQAQAAESPVENLERAVAGIEEAARRGARVVCLQELFRSRYFCQSEDPTRFELAEPVPGPTTETLGKLAVVLGPDGRMVMRYRKMHIPDDPLYYEKYYFTPGDLGFPNAEVAGARVGALVCWDQWFPEAARLTALGGAEILFYPTAIGWQFDEGPEVDAAQHDAWETVQRAHAITNGVFVAAVNRVGTEGDIRFWGRSFVANPYGRVLARAAGDADEVLVVECDLSEVERARQEWPFLRDRRVDAYGDITRRFRD